MGKYFRLKDQWVNRQHQELGQKGEAGCHVFAFIHAEKTRVGCSCLMFGVSLQTTILLSSDVVLGLGRWAGCNACPHHAVSFPSRQNENQMSFPEGLSKGFGP